MADLAGPPLVPRRAPQSSWLGRTYCAHCGSPLLLGARGSELILSCESVGGCGLPPVPVARVRDDLERTLRLLDRRRAGRGGLAVPADPHLVLCLIRKIAVDARGAVFLHSDRLDEEGLNLCLRTAVGLREVAEAL